MLFDIIILDGFAYAAYGLVSAIVAISQWVFKRWRRHWRTATNERQAYG